jgi:hypothetical protein
MRNKILDLPSAHHVIGDLRTHWVLFNFSRLFYGGTYDDVAG